jgi:uncharacterized membrane protein
MAKQDILSKLADKGEEAFSRVAGSQTTARVVESVTGLRERMDDVQKKVRGLDELEKRVAKLEKQLADLQKPKAKPKATRSSSAASAARKKPPSSPAP